MFYKLVLISKVRYRRAGHVLFCRIFRLFYLKDNWEKVFTFDFWEDIISYVAMECALHISFYPPH